MDNCGIYKITCLINNKVYIGCTTKLKIRWSQHKYCLKNNKHGNSYFLRLWKKYGKDAFKFEIIEFCSKNILFEREDYWVKFYKSNIDKFGFNIKSTGPEMNNFMSQKTIDKLTFLNKKRSRKVMLFDLINKIQNEFDSIIELSKYLNKDKSTVCAAIKRNQIYKKRYLIIYKENFDKNTDYLNIKILKRNNNGKSVLQFDLKGNFIKEWKSITNAAKTLKISPSSIVLNYKTNLCFDNNTEPKFKVMSAGKFNWKLKVLN